MTRLLSLAHLTAINLAPPELIRSAARFGFDAVGLRLIRVTDTSPGYPLMHDKSMMRATKTALRETGLQVHDIEFIKVDAEMDVSALEPFLDAGAELGAKEVITAPYDPEFGRLADNLAAIAELAATRNLGVSLEFFPWTVIPDLSAAVALVEAAGPDIGVLVDSLHFNRSTSTLEQLNQTPPSRIRFAHLCDAPVCPPYSEKELLNTARAERLPPGEGQIDLRSFISALPDELPLGVETPMTAYEERHGPDAVIEKAMRATKRLLARST